MRSAYRRSSAASLKCWVRVDQGNPLAIFFLVAGVINAIAILANAECDRTR
ncbi:hypothetical protein NDA03_24445 [Trichocoleus sp. Lan]|uniref:hypothetical protein n=1 Tax=Trichocoleus sp. Lan TaxID=2933927 RepID=UPI0032970BE6